jgi:DNA-binding MarR family transcriptional regulator
MEDAIAVARGVTRLAQRMRAHRPADGNTTFLMTSVLSHLDQQGPMTAGRLADLLRLTPQALTRSLRRLEEEDLISRRPSPDDRRQVHLVLTAAGRTRLAEELRPRAAWLASAMERLSPTEREVLRLAAALMEELASPENRFVG